MSRVRIALVAGVVAVMAAACGSWGYEANPVDGDGRDKHAKVDCFQVYLRDGGHGFLGMTDHLDQMGLYCKTDPRTGKSATP